MKRITFLLFVFCTTICYAQLPPTYPGSKKPVQKNKWNYDPNKLNKIEKDSISQQLMKNQSNLSNINHLFTLLNPKAKFSHGLSNRNKVYLLPVDNTPCIVPDMNQFNMPNPGRNIKTNGMPPGTSPPHKIIPE